MTALLISLVVIAIGTTTAVLLIKGGMDIVEQDLNDGHW